MNQGSERSQGCWSQTKAVVKRWWSSVHSTTRYMLYIIGGCQIMSLLYSQFYYSFSNIPYFMTVKYYEYYRIFTSLFVDRLSLSFFISLIMFTVCASRVENQDGPALMYYRTFLISILSNAVFTLICGIVLHFNSDWGFMMTMAGFDSVWTVFVIMELIRNSEFRTQLRNNRMFLILLIIVMISLLLSLSSLASLLVVGILYLIKPLYTPHKRVIKFFIPYPIFKWLMEQEKIHESEKEHVDNMTRPQMMSVGDVTGSDGVYDMRPSAMPPKKETRFQGVGHTLGS